MNNLQEISQTLKDKLIYLYDLNASNSIHLGSYKYDKGEDSQVIYDNDGIKITMEWNFYVIFIEGLSKEDVKTLIDIERGVI